MNGYPYPLLAATGIELEYMIVDATSLEVMPISDKLLQAAAGQLVSETVLGEIGWSNELVLHVIEFKTAQPVASLHDLDQKFLGSIKHASSLLEPMGACLMPTAMHPWMDPYAQMHLWPHDNSTIYSTFDRIFDCRGHGWANLQSTHINLSFQTPQEFGRLHAAIRLVLPLLPALAASSPFKDGAASGLADTRLDVYRRNSAKVPSVAGVVVPEAVFTPDSYEKEILQRIYNDLAPYDPEGVLRFEWANARGAIARFDRGSIEIRVLDIQECPAADIAIAQAVRCVIEALCQDAFGDFERQTALSHGALSEIFFAAVKDAERSIIDNRDYLQIFGVASGKNIDAAALWHHILSQCAPADAAFLPTLEFILQHGTLSRRILKATGKNPHKDDLHRVYQALCGCLARGELFTP